jgi:hypothetical protein
LMVVHPRHVPVECPVAHVALVFVSKQHHTMQPWSARNVRTSIRPCKWSSIL